MHANSALPVKALIPWLFLGLAACGGDTGTTPAPAPAPAQPLSWLDLPEEAVEVRLSIEEGVNLRLSAAVDASYSVEPADERITVRSETIRAGVVRVFVEGVTPGESGVELRATASGYQPATASFAVVVDETGFGVTPEGSIGCRELDDLRETFRLLLEQGIEAYLEFITDQTLAGQCGLFEEGAEIEWRGEEEFVYGASAIRVWGTPLSGRDLAPAPRAPWWTLREITSFAEDPDEASSFAEPFRGVMERVREIIAASSG